MELLFSAKAETDKSASEAEMKELERQISHDRKLRDFMKLKSQERQEDEELVTYRKRKGLSRVFEQDYQSSILQRLKPLKNAVARRKNIRLKRMKVNSTKSERLVMNKISENSSINLSKVCSMISSM